MGGTGQFAFKAKIYTTSGTKSLVTDILYPARIISVHAFHNDVSLAVAAVDVLVSTATIVRLSSAAATSDDPDVHQFRYPLPINVALDTGVQAAVTLVVTITNGGYVVVLYTLENG